MLTLPFASPRDLPLAAEAARAVQLAHGILGLPTETFYGLAVPPDDAVAVNRLLELKGRPPDKALPVAVANLEQVDALAVLVEPWRSRLLEVWPAPVTVILPSHGTLAAFTSTVALRVPDHALLRRLLARVGPLTVTSANRAGEPAMASPHDVARALGQGLAVLLDGGRTPGGAPSTLVDLTQRPPVVLRAGAFPVPAEWLVVAPEAGIEQSATSPALARR